MDSTFVTTESPQSNANKTNQSLDIKELRTSCNIYDLIDF